MLIFSLVKCNILDDFQPFVKELKYYFGNILFFYQIFCNFILCIKVTLSIFPCANQILRQELPKGHTIE